MEEMFAKQIVSGQGREVKIKFASAVLQSRKFKSENKEVFRNDGKRQKGIECEN
jgi:hypothetical protein